MKKELLEFLTQKETPPQVMKLAVQKDILLSFRGTSIVMKFLFFQILGALFSLSVCPQFGLGLVEGHGITHIFRMMGDWVCAAFCGTFFLSVGMLVAYMGMKGEELWWIWRRYKYSLILLPAALWAGLMFTNVTLDLVSEAPSYHLVWLVTAVLAQTLFFQIRSGLFLRKLTT